MPVLIVMLLVGAVVCALVAAFAPPTRPQFGWVALALVAGALLGPAVQAL